MRSWRIEIVVLVGALMCAACGKPGVDDLRTSFVDQLKANRFVHDLQRTGDELRFSGPGAEGAATSDWRIRIESASIEPNDDPAHPYKGVIKSSWHVGDRSITPRGRDSNLPLELTSNGLAQDCWALWDQTAGRWSWE